MTGRSSWRARIGMVHPSRGDTLMYEYYRAAPPDIVIVPAALGLRDLNAAELERVYEGYESAVRELAYEEVDVVVLGGSPPVTHKGYGFEQVLIERARRLVSCPVVALVRCEVEALRAVGAKRIAVAAPYTPVLTERFAAYFRDAGFDVVATRCLGISRPVEMTKLPLEASGDLARALFREAGAVDAVHLTCPRWRTVAGLAGLERELGVPVTSSSQSVIYATLRRVGVHDEIRGCGSLLERLATEQKVLA